MALGDFLARFGGGQGGQPAEPAAPATPAAPNRDDLGAALDRVEAMVAGGAVPSCVTARVERVTHVVRDTIPRLGAIRGSASAYSVMATATDYLPEALGGYLRLPRRFADSRPVDGGRTSLMVLVDQLDLLGATMDQVFDAVCRDDATALVAHGRFLEEKFGHASTGGELDVGTSYAVPPPPPMPTPAPAEDTPTTDAPSADPARTDTPSADPPRAETAGPAASGSAVSLEAPAAAEPESDRNLPSASERDAPSASERDASSAPGRDAPPGSEPAAPAPTSQPRSVLDLDVPIPVSGPEPGPPPSGPDEPQRLAPPSWP